MKFLVTGAGGQVGSHVVELLGDAAVALTHDDLDVISASSVEDVIDEHRPDVVINLAAYTAVDDAESDEAWALAINGRAPGLIARALARHGDGRLVHVSTDYVFSGVLVAGANRPYEVDDPTDPQSAYGRTKLAGEHAALTALPERTHIVRTAWVFGGPGANFVDTMLRLETERDHVDVVDDQIGCPTWSADLAAALVEVGSAGLPGGVLHYVSSGQATWCELARETFRLAGADPARVRPTDSAAFERPAKRPAWSVLSTSAWTAAGLTAPRPWQDALAACLAARD